MINVHLDKALYFDLIGVVDGNCTVFVQKWSIRCRYGNSSFILFTHVFEYFIIFVKLIMYLNV